MVDIVVGRDDEDLKKYGSRGTVLLGRHIVGTGDEMHMTTPLLLDVLRPHLIILTGKRGEGKCLHENTLIRMEDNSLVPIKDLEDVEKRVLALNENGKIVPAEKTHFYKRKANKLVHLKLRSGREIKLTPEHPLLTLHGWKAASELSFGSKITVAGINANADSSTILLQHKVNSDEIISIGLLEGNFEVYDISVPEYHNFVANDIIVHNSYSMGVMLEEMMGLPDDIRKNLCGLMVDPQGIFWTMKTPNEKDSSLLAEWKLNSRGFDVYVYVPEGQARTFSEAGVDFDGVFAIQPSQLSTEDWLNVFSLDPNGTLGVILQKVLKQFKNQQAYTLDNIISAIDKEPGFENERMALQNMFSAAKEWDIFGAEKMPSVLEPGKVTILDVSLTPQNVRALLVSLACRAVLSERITARRREELAETSLEVIKRTPMPWIFVDEAHNFLPDTGKTAATDVLNSIVREGRQPGITLVLATQRPEKLHTDALAQSDMIISHRLTAKGDIDALKAIMQTYVLYDIGKHISELPKLKGAGIILDDNSERLYKVRIRPRQSWHAGSSPVAV